MKKIIKIVLAFTLMIVTILFFIFNYKFNKDYGILSGLPMGTQVETSKYKVSECEFRFKDCLIIYPNIEIYNNINMSRIINNELKEVLFMKHEESYIENYKGVLSIDSRYGISYYDEDTISFYFHMVIDNEHHNDYYKGITYSIKNNKKINLKDLEIEKTDIVNCAEGKKIYISKALDLIYKYDKNRFSVVSKIDQYDIEEYFDFFLYEDSIFIIVETAPSFPESSGIIKLPYRWKK